MQPTNGKRGAKLSNWVPRKWKPAYEKIVALAALGKTGKFIAEQTGYCENHIYLILRLPQAVELQEQLLGKLRERLLNDVPAILAESASKFAERIRAVAFDDELFKKSPFAVIAAGMKVIEGEGHFNKGKPSPSGDIHVHGNALVHLNEKRQQDFLTGLEKANEVRRLHSGQSLGDQ